MQNKKNRQTKKKKKMQSQKFAICFYGNEFAALKLQDAGRFRVLNYKMPQLN